MAVAGVAAGGVVLGHRLGSVPYFQIHWGDLGGWLAVSGPEDVLVAVVRLLVVGGAWWVLATTSLYMLARLSGVKAAVRMVGWATLPASRRLVDRAVALAVLGSSLLGGAGGLAAAVEAQPPPSTLTTTEAPDGGYQRLPAGRPSVDRPAGKGSRTPLPQPSPALRIPPSRDPVTRPKPNFTSTPSPAQPGDRRGKGGGVGTTADSSREGSEPASPDLGDQQPARRADRSSSYVVVAGDNLWVIAEQRLARAWGASRSVGEVIGYWRRLIDLNVGTLRSGDPDLIYPGEVLNLPEVPPRG